MIRADHHRALRLRVLVLAALAASLLAAAAPTVKAAPAANVSFVGAWTPNTGLAWTITAQSPSGACTGHTALANYLLTHCNVSGAAYVFDVDLSGSSYVSHNHGVISGDSLSGTFSDTNGTTATYTATRKATTVTLSGTVIGQTCSPTQCSRAGVDGEAVLVDGTTSDGTPVTVGTTSAASGAWSVDVKPGQYTVSPSSDGADLDGDGFTPSSRQVSVSTTAVSGLDFIACVASSESAAQGAVAAGARPESQAAAPAAAGATPCPPDAVDWTMSGTSVSDVLKDATNATLGMLPTRDIYAPLIAKLTLTQFGKPYTACSSKTVWKWKVTPVSPASARVDTKSTGTQGCPFIYAFVNESGTYRVTANEFPVGKTKPLRKQPLVDKVSPRQVVVAAMGDSNGSGEGLPPFYFDQCNRGVASYQYQAAHLLEQQADGHAAVTFVSASCSGARTQHLINTQYEGIRPGTPLPPQIDQLERQFAPPSGQKAIAPDATLISIGVNNIGFGPLLAYCYDQRLFHHTACEDNEVAAMPDGTGGVKEYDTSTTTHKTLRQALKALLAALPARFAEVNTALHAHSALFTPGTIYITQYPAFWYSHGNTICTNDPFYGSTWQWLADAGSTLNQRIAAAAHKYGWHLIVVPESAFYDHGYCTTPGISYFVGAIWAKVVAHNQAGAFHPTMQGARVTALQALRLLCPLLDDKTACTTLPSS